ncbi:MAG: tetratricopeptide repeat protein [Verrucomicrobia bacterium]|nr:tetratricopeptide repeat protein [Verrucomicrobiota bacterium]
MSLWEIVRNGMPLAALAVVALWVMVKWWKRSDDRAALFIRWLLTVGVFAFLALMVGPLVKRMDQSDPSAAMAVPLAALAGMVLALVWVPSIVEAAGRHLGRLYDGGTAAPEPEPSFSVAEARRKLGRYAEAIAEIRQQLELFPTDFRLWLMLAEIQAEDLRDVEGAAASIEHLLQQPDHAPKNLAYALSRLADWHLKYRRDPESARRTLERIPTLFPDSPEAHFAHQRLAHLATAERLIARDAPEPLAVPHSDERLGLRADFTGLKPAPVDPRAKAAELVHQLDLHPADNQTREDLALLYASEFHRLDLATAEFEQLLAQPHAPPGRVVHWLNLLAETQLKETGEPALARQTLRRIIDRYPGSAAAATAARRLALLGKQARPQRESQPIKLAPADPRLGLKLTPKPKRDPSESPPG